MSSLIYKYSTSKRVANVFLLVDVSDSKISANQTVLNDAISKINSEICKVSERNADDIEIRCSTLLFANGCRWVENYTKFIDDINWEEAKLCCNSHYSDNVFLELEKKLHLVNEGGWMCSESEYVPPVFILISDGRKIDSQNEDLKKLKANCWFKFGIKIAIAIGNDADREELAKFAGVERTIEVHDIEYLNKVIRFIQVDVESDAYDPESDGEDNYIAVFHGNYEQIQKLRNSKGIGFVKEVNDAEDLATAIKILDNRALGEDINEKLKEELGDDTVAISYSDEFN